MKKRKILLFVCCICLFCRKIEISANADYNDNEDINIELIVLVDTSSSIKGEMKKKEVQWAQEICAICNSLEIGCTYIYFDSPKDEYNAVISVTDDIKTCLEVLEKMPHDGKLTELAGPMEYAINLMERSLAEKKYIIMLSDGDEDLVGRNGQDLLKVPYEECENIKIEKFKSLVCNFNEKENQEVILVGLNKDVSIFSDLRDNYGIQYFSGEEGLEEAIDYTYDNMGYPTERSQGSKDIIELKSNLYRAILNIKWDGNLENIENRLSITYGLKKVEDIFVVPVGKSAVFIYLFDPKPGKYKIEIPVDNLTYTIFQQEKIVFDGIEVNILKDNEIIRGEIIRYGNIELNKYTIEREECTFLVNLKIKKGDLRGWNPIVEYNIKAYNNEEDIQAYIQDKDKMWEKGETKKEAEGVSYKVSNVDVGNYLCTVKLFMNGQTYVSNTIIIQVEEKQQDESVINLSEVELKKINEEIDLQLYTKEIGRTYFIIQWEEDKEERFELNGKVKNENFEVSNKKLIFFKEGIYVMKVAKDKTEEWIEFRIENRKKKNWWCRIWDFWIK